MNGRRRMATAAALLGWLVLASPAFADASFDPNVDVGVSGASGAPILPVALGVLVGFALLVLMRTRGLGGAMTIVGALAGFALGAMSIAAGLFGDWSGRHEIYPIPIAVGIAIIAGVLVGLWRRRRQGQPVAR